MAITWRDVSGPNQSTAVSLLRTSSDQVSAGVSGIVNLANNLAAEELSAFNRERQQNTSTLLQKLNDVNDLDTFEEIANSDALNSNILRDTYGDSIDVSAIQQGIVNRRNALTTLQNSTEARGNLEATRELSSILASKGVDAANKFIETDSRLLNPLEARNAVTAFQDQKTARDTQLRQQSTDNIIRAAVNNIQAEPDNFESIMDNTFKELNKVGADADVLSTAPELLRRVQLARNAMSPIEERQLKAKQIQASIDVEDTIARTQDALNYHVENNPYSSKRSVENNAVTLATVDEAIDKIAPYEDYSWGSENDLMGGTEAKEFAKSLANTYAIYRKNKDGEWGIYEATEDEIKKYGDHLAREESAIQSVLKGEPINFTDLSENEPRIAKVTPWMILAGLRGSANELPQETRGYGEWFTGNTELSKSALKSRVFQTAIDSIGERRAALREEVNLRSQLNASRKQLKQVQQGELSSFRPQDVTTQVNPLPSSRPISAQSNPLREQVLGGTSAGINSPVTSQKELIQNDTIARKMDYVARQNPFGVATPRTLREHVKALKDLGTTPEQLRAMAKKLNLVDNSQTKSLMDAYEVEYNK